MQAFQERRHVEAPKGTGSDGAGDEETGGKRVSDKSFSVASSLTVLSACSAYSFCSISMVRAGEQGSGQCEAGSRGPLHVRRSSSSEVSSRLLHCAGCRYLRLLHDAVSWRSLVAHDGALGEHLLLGDARVVLSSLSPAECADDHHLQEPRERGHRVCRVEALQPERHERRDARLRHHDGRSAGGRLLGSSVQRDWLRVDGLQLRSHSSIRLEHETGELKLVCEVVQLVYDDPQPSSRALAFQGR
eukprot:scaffold109_cov252-Pinguiococcus_pyrenoidosus.AAC.71